jgi:hypothetical protein
LKVHIFIGEEFKPYQEQADALRTQLDEAITDLLSRSFSGSAADGFKDFYTNNIVPANGENLDKLLEALREILTATNNAIPADPGVDELLASENRK